LLVHIGRRQPANSPLALAPTQAAVVHRPLFAHVYVENRCHLQCDHCYESDDAYPQRPSDMTVDDYDALFAQLKELGALVVTLSGGEPFLRKDFLDIVERARKHRLFIRIYTSGTLMTPERLQRMKALSVNEVHVSMYSHDAATHDAFTHHAGSWHKSVQALCDLNALGIKSVLKANVTTFNVDFLDELLALATSVGADLQLDPTIKPKQNGDRSALRYAVPPVELAQKVLARPELHRFVSLEEAEGLCDGSNHRRGGGAMCAAGTKIITIHADGSVAPCTMFPFASGQVKTDRLVDIWENAPLFQNVRKLRFSDMTDCQTCSIERTCDPCMAYAIIENGDHRTCNTSSRQHAEAVSVHSKRVARAHHKMSAGRALPVVGNVEVPGLDPKRSNGGVVTEV
jgi:AdoMet-dependent heme synthase